MTPWAWFSIGVIVGVIVTSVSVWWVLRDVEKREDD